MRKVYIKVIREELDTVRSAPAIFLSNVSSSKAKLSLSMFPLRQAPRLLATGSKEQVDLSTVFDAAPPIVFPANAGLGGPPAALSGS
jgi:hypothetical protein